MKIAVNTRFLLAGKLEGFGRFTYEIMKRVVESHPEVEFIFLFDRPYDTSFIFGKNVTPVVLGPPARHPILFRIWFDVRVKRYLRKAKPDLFLSPDGFLPLGWKGKQLAVIHDLNFEHYPEDLQRKNRRYLKKFFPKFASRADRIATVSKYSAQDIVTTYGIHASKIDVVYNAADEKFCPVSPEIIKSVQNKITDSDPYFVYVGSLNPRKNISRLLASFDRFKSISNSSTKLVIIGDKYWWDRNMEESYNDMTFAKDVIFTGHLESNDMVNILASARAMVYVSYFEGFGIPLVEAMKCGVPVIAGNRTSLPEVGGDAALYVDPFSLDDICNAMILADSDEKLRLNLREKGLKQAEKFNWDSSASNMWNCILKCLGETA